ncbi:hypothetical protein [Pectinatus frisingensis]|uniref:hypothetical protein n=1 Tax=Pectinatus frisingensis TaxID=865 RepID=UPI0018C65720|nr:hypothetical protein [Pectinatus frisingensis]
MADEQNQKVDTTVATPIQAVNDDKAAIKADIEKMTAAVTSLETAGADLFSGAISDIKDSIKAKTDELAVLVEKEKEKTATETAVDVAVKDTETAIENAGSTTTSWWVKSRYDVYTIAGLLMLGYYIFVK